MNMPQTTRRTASRRSTARSAATRKSSTAAMDAIALLKADHRQVETWFEQFEKSRSTERKAVLADQICEALRAHMTIEEEIFYPAFLEATGDLDIHHEAEIEHGGGRQLIAQIEVTDPVDEYFGAKVKVLSEMIKHHVKEEEQPGGMFAKARKSGMDLDELGTRLRERKEALQSASKASRQRAN
jgi:hemerythrin superfamily protein